ncbi:extracellular solute-binding protein [Halioxenophilus sp. WMMB6]|uniref:extracellular solute-binding protein n=1 Tax=Halioxenophilus sp. WMMB6 TaxID=3073815 RepID=UPI00295EA110|nr:extracellular solute-binding protein [Halioxenophilus sp. WMMB6]
MKLKPLYCLTAAFAALVLAGCEKSEEKAAETAVEQPAAAKEVKVYNWSDYIGEEVIGKFEAASGIKVTYDVFDSNEVLEGKLLAGRTGYDVVVPTIDFMARQIQAGVFLPLDKSKLTNYDKLDPKLMATLANLDPGNAYGVPYMWGTTGIGFVESKVVEALGEDAPLDSWELVMNPDNLAKLKDCGVSFLDAPTEIFAAALHYLGKDPNSLDSADYEGEAKALLKSLAPSITYFHSSKYIDDLAAGEICVAVGWSGDIAQAMVDAEEAENGVEISYVIPKEGALLWVDMLGIPKDATNVDEALAFIDYLMSPEIAAENTNYIWYPNPIPASMPMIDEEITSDPSIYPPEDVMAKLYSATVKPAEIDRVINRAWTEIKTGQ